MHDVAVTYVNDQNANLRSPAESPRRTAPPGDMWKCHINSSEHYRDIPLCQPWRQKTWSSQEESDLEDSLTHTSWTLLLIYIPLLTNKTPTKTPRWRSLPDLVYVVTRLFFDMKEITGLEHQLWVCSKNIDTMFACILTAAHTCYIFLCATVAGLNLYVVCVLPGLVELREQNCAAPQAADVFLSPSGHMSNYML